MTAALKEAWAQQCEAKSHCPSWLLALHWKKKIPEHGFSALLLLSMVHRHWMAKAFFRSGALWEPVSALVFCSHRCLCPSAADAHRTSLQRAPKYGTKPSLGARVIHTAEQIIFFLSRKQLCWRGKSVTNQYRKTFRIYCMVAKILLLQHFYTFHYVASVLVKWQLFLF